ncbi:MAG TPA: anti-sigma factor [Chloroflexota bacterium]|jgi:anti-sigma-K factor RskA
MSATPVAAADHSEEFEQLAGLAALRVLDGEEEERFARHAEQCARCRLIVRVDRETLGNLSLAAPEMDPSPDFKRRLMDRAASELAQERAAAVVQPAEQRAPPEPIPLRPQQRPSNVVPFWRRSVWASAVAALLVLGLFSYAGYNALMNQVVGTYAVAQGPASMTVSVRRSGAVELEMHGVAEPPAGFVYEAWIIPPGRQPVAAGITPSGEAKLPLSSDARGATVAVTLERGPSGATAPTSQPLLAVVVAS